MPYNHRLGISIHKQRKYCVVKSKIVWHARTRGLFWLSGVSDVADRCANANANAFLYQNSSNTQASFFTQYNNVIYLCYGGVHEIDVKSLFVCWLVA